MGYIWRILRSAVEQEILFPSKEAFEGCLKSLDKRGAAYEVLRVNTTAAGEIVALMRKSYNNNAFLSGREQDKV